MSEAILTTRLIQVQTPRDLDKTLAENIQIPNMVYQNLRFPQAGMQQKA